MFPGNTKIDGFPRVYQLAEITDTHGIQLPLSLYFYTFIFLPPGCFSPFSSSFFVFSTVVTEGNRIGCVCVCVGGGGGGESIL